MRHIRSTPDTIHETVKDLLLQTYREAPRDADVVSQQLMMRAGMIQKVAAGIYDYLPLALRSIRKFENIVREELRARRLRRSC